MGTRSEDVGEQALMRGLDTAGPIVRLGERAQRAGMVRRAMSHMNAAISRAIAAVTTVGFLPRWISLRYRAVRRDCAFHAMS